MLRLENLSQSNYSKLMSTIGLFFMNELIITMPFPPKLFCLSDIDGNTQGTVS